MTGSRRGENGNREESVGSGAVRSVENYKSWWGCFFFNNRQGRCWQFGLEQMVNSSGSLELSQAGT